jgi:hypothetical protein
MHARPGFLAPVAPFYRERPNCRKIAISPHFSGFDA